MRVAVVEGNQEMAEVLAEFLEGLAHTPVVLRSAEAALAELERGRPDCLLVDLHLPGLAALDFLRSRPVRASEVPIIALAAGDDEADALESLRLGAVDVFARPIAFDRLAEALAYLELGIGAPPLTPAARENRRRAARATIARPAEIVDYDGRRWCATTVDVGLGGVKLQCGEPITDRAAVKVSFQLDDDDAAGRRAEIFAVLIRRDRDGQALAFVNPSADELDRLGRLIESAHVA